MTDIKTIGFVCTGLTVFGKLHIRHVDEDVKKVRSTLVCVSEQTVASQAPGPPVASDGGRSVD